MCKCEICGKGMTSNRVKGCDYTHIKVNGVWMPRIKAGDPGDLIQLFPGERCHDCNALFGHPHHPGCDSETCPVCGGQMITCGCDITEVGLKDVENEVY